MAATPGAAKTGLLQRAFGALGPVAGPATMALMGLGAYRKYRQEGHNRVYSVGRTVWDFGVMMHPLIMTAQLLPAAASMLNVAAFSHINRTRAKTSHFTSPTVDSQELQNSRSQLLQSAVATNGSLRLSGKSWCGAEAAIRHRNLGIG